MGDEKNLDQMIYRYLLGELTEQEQTRVEKRYFKDPDFLKKVQSARDDLVDAYVSNQMPSPQRRSFERQLEENPALRSRVEFAKVLLQRVDAEQEEDDESHNTNLDGRSGARTGRK